MPTTIEEGLVWFLTNDPGVTALVGLPPACRIYPEMAPEDVVFPHIVYQVIDFPQADHLAGLSGLGYPRIQISCWGQGRTGKADCIALANAVKSAQGPVPTGRKMNGFSGYWSDLWIQKCILADRRYSSEPPIHAEEAPYRRADLDFQVWFGETP